MSFNEKKITDFKKDKSNKQSVDKAISKTVKLINSLDNYYTTSSCAGRIVVIKIPKSRKKNKSKILLKIHSKVTFKEIKNVIKPNKEVIWFGQEPVILHIGAKRLSDAERMLTIAREIGLKRSGIISSKRLIMEIIGTEYISTMLVKDNKILVDDSYIEMLIIEANKNLERTRDKLRKFHSVISKRLT